MSNYVLGGYLILVGIVTLFRTEIPTWVVGVAALAAGAAIIVERGWKRG